MEFKDPPLPLRVGCFVSFLQFPVRGPFKKFPQAKLNKRLYPQIERALVFAILFSQPTPPPEAESDCWAFPVDAGTPFSPAVGAEEAE